MRVRMLRRKTAWIKGFNVLGRGVAGSLMLASAALGPSAGAQNVPEQDGRSERAPGLVVPAPGHYLEGFETWDAGAAPGTWSIDAGNGRCEIIERDAASGQRCMRIVPDDPRGGPVLAVLSIDASMFGRGWHRCSVRLRQENPGGVASMWMRATTDDGTMLAGASSELHPVTGTQWTESRALFAFPEGTKIIEVGVAVNGGAGVAIDDVTIGPCDPPKSLIARAAPLEAQERRNLIALARAWGPVRYFHASDRVIHADWNLISLRAIRAMREARDDDEAMETLRACLAPVCPQLTFARAEAETDKFENNAAPRVAIPATATSESRLIYRGYADPLAALGVPGSDRSVYGCTRDVAALSPQALESRSAEPLATIELGNGYRLILPPAWLDKGGGDVPPFDDAHADGPAHEAAPALHFSDDEVSDAIDYRDRATRIASVIVAWATLTHFYPYFSDVRVDWDGELERALNAAAVNESTDAHLRTLETLLASLHDGHGVAFVPGATFCAPLPMVARFIGDDLVVLAADQATGAHPGDVVVSVDAKPVPALVQSLTPRVSAATDRLLRLRLAQRILVTNVRADESSTRSGSAMIELRRPDGSSITTRVEPRPTYELPRLTRPNSGEEVSASIVYCDLVGADIDAMQRVMPKLRQARGIVFDLRGYPDQGVMLVLPMLTDQVQHSAAWHIPMIRKPALRDVEWTVSAWTLPPIAPKLAAKIAFLTDANAISYGESVMEIVEHNRLGRIVGEGTAGTNGNVNTIDLPGGGGMQFTGMRVVKQDGVCIHGVGVTPTDPVTPTLEGILAGRDEVLEKAIAILREAIDAESK